MCLVAFAKILGWEIIDDYLLKRPWHQLFKFDLDTLAQTFSNKGMFTKELADEMLRPVLRAIDKKTDITLAEFYELTQVEMHFMTSEMVEFKLVDVSHKTHPQWTLSNALYSSICLPFLFKPLALNGGLYMDGSLFQHYPLKSCISGGAVPDEILGITNYFESPHTYVPEFNNLLDYVMYISGKVLNHVLIKNPVIKHNIIIPAPDFISVYDIMQTVVCQENRAKEVGFGGQIWRTFSTKMYTLKLIRLRGTWDVVCDTEEAEDVDAGEPIHNILFHEYPMGY